MSQYKTNCSTNRLNFTKLHVPRTEKDM